MQRQFESPAKKMLVTSYVQEQIFLTVVLIITCKKPVLLRLIAVSRSSISRLALIGYHLLKFCTYNKIYVK
jgi:hypothetical protein